MLKQLPVEPASAVTIPAELQALSTQDLRAELGRALNLTAEHLQRLAAIWAELQRRGEDLSDLRSGLANYLPQIAAGRLDANVLIQYAGNRTLLRLVAELPIEQQRAIAAGAEIPVLAINPDGEYHERRMAVSALTGEQARLALSDGRLHSVDEQRGALEAKRLMRAKRMPTPARGSRVRIEPRSGDLVVGRTRVTVGEVVAALAEIYVDREQRDIPDKGQTVMLTLSEEEHRALKIRAAEGNVTMQRLIRGALGKMGVLG